LHRVGFLSRLWALRLHWSGAATAFDFSGISTAAITSILFTVFARRTMMRYFNVDATAD